MIVKDEAAVLADCLEGACRFADELVIVDTGSTDETKEIASRYTDRVFDFTWCDDFASARNFSYSKASCDHIMWLDADDRITPENIQRILEWKALKNREGASSVRLIIAGYERPENGGVFLYPRIIRRDAGLIWKGIIHEHLVTDGQCPPLKEDEIETAEFSILHAKQKDPDYGRNIRIMEALPEEELHRSFWLCANCFLDCVMYGDVQRAEKYLDHAQYCATPFEERLKDYALINTVLKHHRKYDAMLKWNAMYLRCRTSGK
ncbi:MAG: glycosyltransferase family 2 protein [Lachnospiraceae bacterium]|nr:glycosyltransferase family 2 protein [Lachnospiraceae bacterium]